MTKYINNLDRLDKLGIHYNICREDRNGYWINHYKKAVKSMHNALYFENPYTKLNTCEICNKVSTPKRVRDRNEVYRWEAKNRNDLCKSKTMLCTGCWNKVKPIVKAKAELAELKYLTYKLTKERLQCQKSQQQAN